MEYRSFECRADASDMTISGVCILFERWQRVAQAGQAAYAGSDGTREKILETSIRIDADGKPFVGTTYRYKKPRPIKAIVNHNEGLYLASTDSSLKLKKTKTGLEFLLGLPNTNRGRDIAELAKAEGSLPVSVGFIGRGRRSKIKRKPVVSDDPRKTEQEIDALPLQTQPPDQPLDGSDWVEGYDANTGRKWRAYFSLDLRELSILEGLDPAWEGVTASPGVLPSNRAVRSQALLDYYERVYV